METKSFMVFYVIIYYFYSLFEVRYSFNKILLKWITFNNENLEMCYYDICRNTQFLSILALIKYFSPFYLYAPTSFGCNLID